MSVIFDITTTFEPQVCGSCGVQFALTETMFKKLKRNKKFFYCVNGCYIHFYGESEEERLGKALTYERARVSQKQEQLQQVNRSRAALKGQVTKIKRRIGRGICPCCSRTFVNLGRHMSLKHPDWRETE